MAQVERTASRLASRPVERPAERRFERPTDRGLTAAGGEIDQSRVPNGYVMEFKRHTILGQRDSKNIALIRQYGWEPVPHRLQPHIMGNACADPETHVTRGSDALYMRPAYLNEEAHEENARDTADVLRNQLMALKQESKGNVGEKHTYVKKTTVAVPADTN